MPSRVPLARFWMDVVWSCGPRLAPPVMNASQNRREFKFVLPAHLGEVIRQRVGEVLEADRGAEDGYPILSEYYDTSERTSYWQKQFGFANRRRVRTRVYGRRDG